MMHTKGPLQTDNWLANLFTSKAAMQGQVVRRSRRDIERYCGMDRFLADMEIRGFQALTNRDQVIIFCNAAPITRLRKPSDF